MNKVFPIIEDKEIKKVKGILLEYNLSSNKYYYKNTQIDNICKFLKENKDSYEAVIFKYDFSKDKITLNQSDIIVKGLKKLLNKKYLLDKKKHIDLKTGNSVYEEFIKIAVGVLNFNTKKEQYNYLYDRTCDYLDDRVVKCNACGFKEDKCEVKRNTNTTMGCCHHYKNKKFGILYEKNLILCEYQKDKMCTAKCLTCKLYMCDAMKKKGYNFNIKNIISIKRYFNIIQKIILSTSFFTTKDEILKKIYFFK